MLQNIINRFNLNSKGNLPVGSTLQITLPFYVIIGILSCLIILLPNTHIRGFLDVILTIFIFVSGLISSYIAPPMAALAFAAFLGSFIKYTIVRHTIIFGVFLIVMYPIFTFDVFDLLETILLCAPTVLGLITSAFIELKLKKQSPTEHFIDNATESISENIVEKAAPTNIIDKIISRFTLDKTNKLPARHVSIIILPFILLGWLIMSIITLASSPNSPDLLTYLLIGLVSSAVFSIYWLIVSFLTALFVRFTSNTIVNYTLLGATWLFLFALQQEFNLEYILLNKVSLLSIGTLLIIGLVAIAYIELKLKKKLL